MAKYDQVKRVYKRGPEHKCWRGGRTVDKSGYVLIYAPKHPNCNSSGYVREHRLVVENHLGRLLDKKEVVHHKNGVHSDNRIENLEVFRTNSEHLKHELTGKIPQWTEDGKMKMSDGMRCYWESQPRFQRFQKKEIDHLYNECGFDPNVIAVFLDCDHKTVRRYLKYFGLQKKGFHRTYTRLTHLGVRKLFENQEVLKLCGQKCNVFYSRLQEELRKYDQSPSQKEFQQLMLRIFPRSMKYKKMAR